jgi:hypothetical protein
MEQDGKGKRVKDKAVEILGENPQGMRYSDLVRKIVEALPDIPPNTIHGNVWDLDKTLESQIYKPIRGLFRLKKFSETEFVPPVSNAPTIPDAPHVREKDFYQPFAEWLVGETEDCTKAIPLGGSIFGAKWGTPDVIGVWVSKAGDIVQVPTEVVSVEIKTDTNELITAFGQACAYKLFSHKVYLLIPNQSSEEDVSRLDSLCLIFGIGLVLFDAKNPALPNFSIQARPTKHEPDIYYTNKFLRMIENFQGKLF